MDIREIVTELQKINKMQYCLIFSLKNNTKVVISSPVGLNKYFDKEQLRS